MKVHVDRVKFTRKPNDYEIGGIKARFINPGSILDWTVQQVATALTGGHTIQPGVTPFSERSRAMNYKGTRAEDFSEQRLFMVDMDNKRTDIPRTTPAQALEALAAHNLPIAFGYQTFNSTPEQERFRIALVCDEAITDDSERERIITALIKLFPQSDQGCTNADRIFFGTDKGLYPEYGDMGATCRKADLLALADTLNVTATVKQSAPADGKPAVPAAPAAKRKPKFGQSIPEGERHKTLLAFAVSVLKRYGQTEKAAELFGQRIAQCEAPMPDGEIDRIWKDANGFYERKILTALNYRTPDEYNGNGLRPKFFTDVDEAAVLFAHYEPRLRFSDATGWIFYDGTVWAAGEQLAHACMHELTEQQIEALADVLAEAREALRAAEEAYVNAEFDPNVGKPEKQRLRLEKLKAQARVEAIEKEEKFYLKCRGSTTIKNVLKEAETFLWIDVADLDADAFLLNTPGGAVDLRTGDLREHNPYDFCTKITNVAPDDDGAELFREFLAGITSGDADTQRYLQEAAGMFLVGAVFLEKLTIAYGTGGNGKSTFFNLLVRVMGSYAGYIASDVLIATTRNKAPEFAELRGKRLVVAGETEEGMRLDTATVKRMSSTDPIRGEAKYHAPFDFVPSHSTLLYTNHLPKVGTIDDGTWDRLVIVPFTARFRGTQGEILNYTEHLFKHCGGAVLSWMIQGARRFVANRCKIELPAMVNAANANYRDDNDWLNSFLETCCQQGAALSEKSGELYLRYRSFCERTGEYTRNAPDFKAALSAAGFLTVKTPAGMVVKGLRLLSDFEDAVPPLTEPGFIEVHEQTPWGAT